MADIKIWKCDICGKRIEEGEAGFLNRHNLCIDVNLGEFHGNSVYTYNDACYDCRNKIDSEICKLLRKMEEHENERD